MENAQGNTSQPVEIEDSRDEQPPQLEGEENEKELGGNKEGEMGEETEQCKEIPLQNPLQEDELAQILANMGKYAQPLSPLGLHTEEEPEEQSAQNKNTPEELSDEEEKEENHSIHDVSMTGEKSDEDT